MAGSVNASARAFRGLAFSGVRRSRKKGFNLAQLFDQTLFFVHGLV